MRWVAAGGVVLVLALLLVGLPGDEEAPVPSPPQPSRDGQDTGEPTVPPVVPEAREATAPESPAAPAAAALEEAGLLIRLVDTATGKPIIDLESLVISWDRRRKGRRGGIPHEEGWFRVPASVPGGPIELGVCGYARGALDLGTAKGRVELPLDPVDAPAARARIPGSVSGPPVAITVSLRPIEVDRRLPEFEVIGLPHSPGPFYLYDLPEGRYEIEVTAQAAGVCMRAKKRFEHLGGTTAIGDIELEPWAGIRARVVDLDGKLVPQARVVIVREEEDEKKGRIIEPDHQGWVTFLDFEPGAWHRVAAFGLPGPLERLVLAPEKKGGLVTVELTWPGRLTSCVIRFRDGETVLALRELRDGPVALREEHYGPRWSVMVPLLPGEYEWKWGPPDLPSEERSGAFVVPPRRSWEAVVQLKAREKDE
jgi:hypothetical protein